MKLAVFKDYGVGRYFAQLFDSFLLVIRQAALPLAALSAPITGIYYDEARENGLAFKAVLGKMEHGR